MTSRWARFARGWAAAVFSTFVAALSHTLGGAQSPGLLPVVVSLAFAGIICVGMTGRDLSRWRLAVSVIASQLIFHALFALSGPASSPAAAPAGALSPAALAEHHHSIAGLSALHGAAAHSGPAGASHALLPHAPGMWMAHALAALVTIVALRHGEAAVWGILATARLAIRRVVQPLALAIAPHVPQQTVVAPPVACPVARDLLFSAMRHRGPPALVRAFARPSRHSLA